MSDPNKFAYHAHLADIAMADVDLVITKDTSYGASWKQSGGRSAWFMIVRKIDRLREIMKPPKPPNTFNMTNVDNTIAAIRDEQPFPGTPEATANLLQHLRDAYVSEDIFHKVEAGPQGEDGTVLAEIRDLRRYLLLVEAEMVERGVVAAVQPQVPKDYKPLKPDANLDGLRGYSIQGGVPQVPVHAVGDPAPVPVEDSNRHAERERSLRVEVNDFERRELPVWAQDHYEWVESRNTWRLKP